MNSSVSNFWPGVWSISDCMLKLGTFLRKSLFFSSNPFIVSRRSSLVTAENGKDFVQHFVHSQSCGSGRSSPVRFTQFRWLNLEHVWQNANLGVLFILLEQVSHLVFLAGSGELQFGLFVKKSRSSQVSRAARGNADWWHWLQSQSTPRALRLKNWAVLIFAHLTWKQLLQWLHVMGLALAEIELGQAPQGPSGMDN